MARAVKASREREPVRIARPWVARWAATEAADVGGDGGGAGGPSNGNVLSERFLATPAFSALVTAATSELTATLYASGAAERLLAEWSTTLTTQADDLVTAATVAAEADAVRASFARYL